MSVNKARSMEEERFTLKWDLHKDIVIENFENMYAINAFTDCILMAGEREIHAHKVILSSCSTHFRKLFEKATDKVPLIIFHDVTFEELRALVEYMYRGEVILDRCTADRMWKLGKDLKVQGFLDKRIQDPKNDPNCYRSYKQEPDYPMRSCNGWIYQNLLPTEQIKSYEKLAQSRNFNENSQEQRYKADKIEGFFDTQGFNETIENIQKPSQALTVIIPPQIVKRTQRARNVTKRKKDIICYKSLTTVKKKSNIKTTDLSNTNKETTDAAIGQEQISKPLVPDSLLEPKLETTLFLQDGNERVTDDFSEELNPLSPTETSETFLPLPSKTTELKNATEIIKPMSLEDVRNSANESETEESDTGQSISVYTQEESLSNENQKEELKKDNEGDSKNSNNAFGIVNVLYLGEEMKFQMTQRTKSYAYRETEHKCKKCNFRTRRLSSLKSHMFFTHHDIIS